MSPSERISIAGAGPAGLTAAITLAHAGYPVVVHERQQDVGLRFCEDYQALENWTSAEDVLDTIQPLGYPDWLLLSADPPRLRMAPTAPPT